MWCDTRHALLDKLQITVSALLFLFSLSSLYALDRDGSKKKSKHGFGLRACVVAYLSVHIQHSKKSTMDLDLCCIHHPVNSYPIIIINTIHKDAGTNTCINIWPTESPEKRSTVLNLKARTSKYSTRSYFYWCAQFQGHIAYLYPSVWSFR